MNFLIYLETNWIVGAVMGQDTHADELLLQPRENVSIALPMVCVMEAVSNFDRKRDDRNELTKKLSEQITQLQRSGEVEIAQNLVTDLVQAELTNAKLLSELFHRLDHYLTRIVQRAELLPISNGIVEACIQLTIETELDRDGSDLSEHTGSG